MEGQECEFYGKALVKILNSDQETLSDFFTGEFSFANVETGSYTIIAIKQGYYSVQQNINVLENETTEVQFELVAKYSGEGMGGLSSLVFDVSEPPFDDIKVRKALNYAIDKVALTNDYNAEFGEDIEASYGPVPPNMLGYNSELNDYLYDSTQAESLLSQSGYDQGLSLDLYFFENEKDRFIVEEIQAYLAQVGVNVTLHGISGWYDYLGKIENQEFSFFKMNWYADTADTADFLYSLFHSQGNVNLGNYSNTTVDSKINGAYLISSENDYIQQIQKTSELIVEDAPALFCYYY
jgi:ABC-type transport system substrate-binding protein